MRSNAETHKFLEKKLESITNDNLRNSSLLLTNRTKIFIMITIIHSKEATLGTNQSLGLVRLIKKTFLEKNRGAVSDEAVSFHLSES